MSIRIISRRIFRFYNPSQKLVSSHQNSEGFEYQELAIPANVTVGKENLTAELFFDTVPGEPQLAPDWIKAETKDMVNITTFRNAVRDGMLMEVNVVSEEPRPVPRSAQAPPQVPVAPLPGSAMDFPVVDAAAVDAMDEQPAVEARPLAGGKIPATRTRNQGARG